MYFLFLVQAEITAQEGGMNSFAFANVLFSKISFLILPCNVILGGSNRE